MPLRVLMIAGLVSLVGCSSAEGSPDLDLVKGTISGVRLGDPVDIAVSALGEPTRRSDFSDGSEEFLYGAEGALRLRVILRRADAEGPLLVTGFAIQKGYDGRTRGGVGIGSEQADVEKEVGEARLCAPLYSGLSCTYRLATHDLNVQYGLTAGGRGKVVSRVAWLYVAARPEV